ncbi:MAG: sigma-70 family RNA polymerase sigma factor [Terrimonas sp.]|nr:sigma-70 family RNA polymerase sigma factor [Terrimonas sp.]
MSEKDFLHLLNENRAIIYKVVQLYAVDPEEKKDLYQEIVLQCWKGWSSFRGESKFSTWLYRICLNTIFTAKRKKSRVEYREELPDVQKEQHRSLEQEEKQQLYAAIRQLAETDRAIISLHLDGYSNNDIAAMMGISVNSTNVKLFRIRERLSKILKPAAYEP